MKYYTVYLCSILLLITSSCILKKNADTAVSQGIAGKVTFMEGNMMPGPGKKDMLPKGVERNVYIYAVANSTGAEGTGPLYDAVKTQLIAKVRSDTAGFYKCSLKPGKYSVFTEEEGHKLFSGLSNEKAELSPVEVLPGKVTAYDVVINYKAVY